MLYVCPHRVVQLVVVTRKSDGAVTINGVTEDASIVLSIARKVGAQAKDSLVELQADDDIAVENFETIGFSSVTLNEEALAA